MWFSDPSLCCQSYGHIKKKQIYIKGSSSYHTLIYRKIISTIRVKRLRFHTAQMLSMECLFFFFLHIKSYTSEALTTLHLTPRYWIKSTADSWHPLSFLCNTETCSLGFITRDAPAATSMLANSLKRLVFVLYFFLLMNSLTHRCINPVMISHDDVYWISISDYYYYYFLKFYSVVQLYLQDDQQ